MTKKRTEPFGYQQGDVRILPVEIPKNAKAIQGTILRRGEATGHAHVAVAEDVTLFLLGDTLYMSSPTGTTVVHEEHQPITIPPGDYVINAVQEYDHFAEEARDVMD